MQKYGFDDARPVLERASARETAARVALGAVAQAFLARPSASGWCRHVVAIGAAEAPDGRCPTPDDVDALDADPVRCLDPDASAAMVAEIDAATRTATRSAAWSRCSPTACPPGLGSHVHWDRRLDSRLAGALMGIQAIKGVEVGDGFRSRRRRGSAGARRDRARRRRRIRRRTAGPAASRAA